MILCSGAFDGLHAGHVRYLQAAQALCPTEALHVAIAPDDYIRSCKQREPLWTQTERAITVRVLRCVDEIILQQELTVAAVIRKYRPQRFVKGIDWRDKLTADVVQACLEVGTDIIYVNTPGTHVSQTR